MGGARPPGPAGSAGPHPGRIGHVANRLDGRVHLGDGVERLQASPLRWRCRTTSTDCRSLWSRCCDRSSAPPRAEPGRRKQPGRCGSPAGWCSTKSLASCWATVIRLGVTSVAHMDRDTSRARMTEVCEVDTVRVSWGRAAPTPRTTMLARRRATGRWRFHQERRGSDGAQQGHARVAHGLAGVASAGSAGRCRAATERRGGAAGQAAT